MVLNEVFDVLKLKLKGITEVKNIEWYLDQDKDKGVIAITPAVFILFTHTPRQISKNSIENEITFELKLFTDYKKANSKLTNDNKHFAIENRIFELMSFDKYEQVGIVPMRKEGKFLYSSQSYKTKIVTFLPKKPAANTINSQNISPVIKTT